MYAVPRSRLANEAVNINFSKLSCDRLHLFATHVKRIATTNDLQQNMWVQNAWTVHSNAPPILFKKGFSGEMSPFIHAGVRQVYNRLEDRPVQR
jgi:hypothetical protein